MIWIKSKDKNSKNGFYFLRDRFVYFHSTSSAEKVWKNVCKFLCLPYSHSISKFALLITQYCPCTGTSTTSDKPVLIYFSSTSTRLEEHNSSVGPWPLVKPVLLDQLNLILILNLNQARGPNQLSWTLISRVSTFRQTSSIGSTQPQPGPAKQYWLKMRLRLRHSQLS